MNIPCGFANFAIDPLFNKYILNGDDMADATFALGLSLNFLSIIRILHM